MLKAWKYSNIDFWRRMEQILSTILFLQAMLGKEFEKQRNLVKLDRIQNIWHLLWRFFVRDCQMRIYCKGVLIIVPLFPKNVSIKLFSNLLRYTYKCFFLLGIKFRLTRGECNIKISRQGFWLIFSSPLHFRSMLAKLLTSKMKLF